VGPTRKTVAKKGVVVESYGSRHTRCRPQKRGPIQSRNQLPKRGRRCNQCCLPMTPQLLATCLTRDASYMVSELTLAEPTLMNRGFPIAAIRVAKM
jgi:hypothetical protein